MSDSRDGFPLRDLINKEKISLKKETQLFPKEKSKYWWLAFQSSKYKSQKLSLFFSVALFLYHLTFTSIDFFLCASWKSFGNSRLLHMLYV